MRVERNKGLQKKRMYRCNFVSFIGAPPPSSLEFSQNGMKLAYLRRKEKKIIAMRIVINMIVFCLLQKRLWLGNARAYKLD